MKTADLQGAALDYWVARAEGRTPYVFQGLPHREEGHQGIDLDYVLYAPSTDWADGGPLIEKYCLTPQYRDYGGWRVDTALTTSLGDTPLQAICRAVVRAAFGDEVEDLPK